MLCLFLLSCPRVSRAEDPRPVPSYTNEDLERVAPYRGETGVLSQPAVRSEPAARGAAREPKQQGEAYWRREADRLRTRLRPLRRHAEDLRRRLEEARSEEWRKRPQAGRGAGRASAESLARQLESVETEIREREDELYERARRERVLPGWLR